MIKKTTMIATTAVVITVISLFVVGTAFAQSPTPQSSGAAQTPWVGPRLGSPVRWGRRRLRRHH